MGSVSLNYDVTCLVTYSGVLNIDENNFEDIVCETEEVIGKYILSQINLGEPQDIDIENVDQFELVIKEDIAWKNFKKI